MTTSLIADQTYTLNHYLERSGRDFLPLSRDFLRTQLTGERNDPGPLAAYVVRGAGRALNQYLLAHSFASAPDPETGLYDVRLPGFTWARALGAPNDAAGDVKKSWLHAVSRGWKLAENFALIGRERSGGRVRVWLKADDGSGKDYARPADGQLGNQLADGDSGYLKLPYAYWLDGWQAQLDIAGTAMLLIALSLGDGFTLPARKADLWYGLSESTAERGLRELNNLGLLHREKHRRPDTEAPKGFSDVWYYELTGAFGPRGFASRRQHPNYVGARP